MCSYYSMLAIKNISMRRRDPRVVRGLEHSDISAQKCLGFLKFSVAVSCVSRHKIEEFML